MASSAFSTRNAYYLRISRDTVLSMYAYIEQQHVGWMTDYMLQVRARRQPSLALRSAELSTGPRLTLELLLRGSPPVS